MMNKKNNKGFTLAELLIVVAIIAVLVAVAIPVFTTQLRKAELATDLANTRGAYAEAVAEKLANNTYTTSGKLNVGSIMAGLKHTKPSVKSADHKITLKHSKDATITGSFAYDSDVSVKGVK